MDFSYWENERGKEKNSCRYFGKKGIAMILGEDKSAEHIASLVKKKQDYYETYLGKLQRFEEVHSMVENNRSKIQEQAAKVLRNRPSSYKVAALSALNSLVHLHNKDRNGGHFAFDNVVDINALTELKAVFLTSAGVVTGEFPPISNEEERRDDSTIEQIFYIALENRASEMYDEQGVNAKFTPGAMMPLLNVSIKTNAGDVFHFNDFILFSEDVIGFHFVPKDFKIE